MCMMCRVGDTLQMACGRRTCLRTTYMPADDVHTCGRRTGRHMSSATWNLQRSLTLVSSARRPCVVCTSSTRRLHETSVSRLFRVKQQRTALLKMGTQPFSKYSYSSVLKNRNRNSSTNRSYKYTIRVCKIKLSSVSLKIVIWKHRHRDFNLRRWLRLAWFLPFKSGNWPVAMHLIWPLASRLLSQPKICRRVIESDGVTSRHRRLCRLTSHMSLLVKVKVPLHWAIANAKTIW